MIPKEGAIIYFDMLAIPADAPHPENALAFLNYMMDPQVIAKVTNKVRFANGNLASLPYVEDAIKNDPGIYPTPRCARGCSRICRIAAVQPRAEPLLDARPQRSVTSPVPRCLAFAAIAALAACGGKAEEKKQLTPAGPKRKSSTSSTGPTTSARTRSRTSRRRPASRSPTTPTIRNEVLETKLLTGHTGYDIVVPTQTFAERMIKAGVFRKLDKSKLPNLSNMDADIMRRVAVNDPGNEYLINYMWGTTGIGYNPTMVKKALGTDRIDSWSAAVRSEDRGQAREVRHHDARCPGRRLRFRADLPGP